MSTTLYEFTLGDEPIVGAQIFQGDLARPGARNFTRAVKYIPLQTSGF